MEKVGGVAAVACSPMELPTSTTEEQGPSSSLRSAETLLRLAPVGLCVAALVIMIKNKQTNEFGSVSYSDLGAFKYLVHVNGICACYSLLSAVIAAMPRPSTMPRAWIFFFLDQVLTYLILAAGVVSAEVLYLAENGDDAITWSEVCSSFSPFCHKATASVTITFVVVTFYLVLSLLSSYKLFSKYDPPATASNNSKGSEVAAAFYA